MLPDCRTTGDLYPIPKFDLETNDVTEFNEELKGYHNIFSDCFLRQEPRDNFYRYMVGQFSNQEKKSIEPIALNVINGNVRAMQRFVSSVVWDEEKMLSIHRSMIKTDMGDPDGVLIFDESGFLKKGNDSAGVAKQYCGNLGKVENCQVVVFAGYASRYGYSVLDSRLFFPAKWFGEDYEYLRTKCGVPEDLTFKTKPQLAVDMFNTIVTDEKIPFKYVVADSLYGNSREFREAVEKRDDIVYFVSMPCDTLCWLKMPVLKEKEYKYNGEKKTKVIVEKNESKPVSFEKIAKSTNPFFWYKRKVSEGTKGPIKYEFNRKLVILSKDGLPEKTVWLVIKRNIEKKPQYSYYICNAPVNIPLSVFVWLSSVRWAIEQCFEETKSGLGMDQYQVRKYAGWYHHMLTCMLGHFFLWHIKIKLGKKSTCYYDTAN